MPIPDTLDLGCGAAKANGAYGIDFLALEGVDVVHDLNSFPWPLPSDHFSHVRAMDILEHLEDFIAAVRECHRVLRPTGRLTVQMPFAGSSHHHTDPTHRRAATSRTLDYFVEGSEYSRKYRYTEPLFRMEGFRYIRHTAVRNPVGWLMRQADRLLVPYAERRNDAYEAHFSGIYPMHAVVFECIKR